MRGTTVAVWFLVFWISLIVLVATLLGRYSAADVMKVCAGRAGVQQLVDTTWDAGKGNATVICKNGYVGNIGS